MAKVSISEAARLAGIARSNFYTTYIKKGRISVSTDSKGKKFIDTSELLRVFPDIKQDSDTGQRVKPKTGQSVQDRTAEKTTIEGNKPDHSAELELLKTKLAASEAQVKELQTDKEWFKQQIAEEKARAEKAEIKLLEHLAPAEPPEPKKPNPELEALLKEITEPKPWWQFWK